MEEATCERIIKSVDAVLKKDLELDEFDVIPSLGEVNKTPVVHMNHKLAVESWCIKYVYKHAYTSILHFQNTGGYEYSESLVRWTQFCLLRLPEVTTFWNIRKKMIQKMMLKPDADLLLSKLVLTRKPKCIEAFQHRRWLFSFVLSNDVDDNLWRNDLAFNNNFREPENQASHFWRELDLCTWTAERKANNYHSWNHRIWVVERLASFGNVEELYKIEYDASQDWISLHVSEHSGMHYRSKILEAISIASERGSIQLERIHPNVKFIKKLYLEELKLNNELLHVYPEHESLFYHRRYILGKLQNLYGNHGQRASSPPPAFKRSCIETLNTEWSAVLQQENEMIDTAKCVSVHHHQLLQQHSNWLNNVCSY